MEQYSNGQNTAKQRRIINVETLKDIAELLTQPFVIRALIVGLRYFGMCCYFRSSISIKKIFNDRTWSSER